MSGRVCECVYMWLCVHALILSDIFTFIHLLFPSCTPTHPHPPHVTNSPPTQSYMYKHIP